MLGDLYRMLDFSSWKTLTPEASVRRIVQEPGVSENKKKFFSVQPGLWALTEYRDAVLKQFQLDGVDAETPDGSADEPTQTSQHAFNQRLIVEIGNMKEMRTIVASGDQNKICLGKYLKDIMTLESIYEFGNPKHLDIARRIDVTWFKADESPAAFFEVEHTTDIMNSLTKFHELQQYNAKFYIVAKEEKRGKFNAVLSKSVFRQLQGRVEFRSYDHIATQYEVMSACVRELAKIETI